VSYDFYMQYVEGRDIDESWRNITFNLRDMFVALFEKTDCDWDDLTDGAYKTDDALGCFQKALNDLREHREEYKQYDAPNGWGTTEGAEMFLEDMIEHCLTFPGARIVCHK